jgi:hypothetical protein
MVEEFRHHRIFGVVARHLGMDMDVDGDDLGGIDGHGLSLCPPPSCGGGVLVFNLLVRARSGT